MSSLPSSIPSLDEIESELLDCDSPTERLEYLVELGAVLPKFPEDQCIEANRVLGCQSMVWLVHQVREQQIDMQATSDAPMVRGLIAILLAAYSGKSADEIVAFDIEAYFDRIQLRSFITPMRSNGLHSMVLRVQSIAKSLSKNLYSRSRRAPTRGIHEVANDFPFLNAMHSSGRRLVYLDNAASSQRPRQVIDAMTRVYENHYANVHRSGHELAAITTTAMEQARKSIARFIGASGVDEIVFTSGTTAGINLIARAWGDANLKAGDEIILTEMEHHSNIVPWQQLAARTGAVIRWLPIDEHFQLDLKAYASLLSNRTKLVSVTAVSNVLGTINPIEEITKLAKIRGATVLVDAAQSAPHGGVDAEAYGADFIVFSGHKILGPSGIGVLYGRREILESMPPFMGGGNMIHSVDYGGFVPAGIPHRFEAGTAPIVEAIAMHHAIEYLESLGSQAIIEHEQRLSQEVQARLRSLDRVKIYGPDPSLKTGIVTFTIDGLHPDEVGKRLDSLGIAVRVGHHCAMPLHKKLGLTATCRASFYIYNTCDDVARFCEAIERLM